MLLSFTVTNCYSKPSVVCDPYSTITTHLHNYDKVNTCFGLFKVFISCSTYIHHISSLINGFKIEKDCLGNCVDVCAFLRFDVLSLRVSSC